MYNGQVGEKAVLTVLSGHELCPEGNVECDVGRTDPF
jgi:hypothetical protein